MGRSGFAADRRNRRAVRQAGLYQNSMHVVFDRGQRYPEPRRDLLVGQALRDQLCNVSLARRKACKAFIPFGRQLKDDQWSAQCVAGPEVDRKVVRLGNDGSQAGERIVRGGAAVMVVQ